MNARCKDSDTIIEQRAYIKFRTKLGIAPKAILEELVIVCPDTHLSYSRVCEWAARFREGRLSVEDDHRPGPGFTVRTDDNITRIKAIVEEDPHCNIKEIALESGISTGSVERILTMDLQMRKLCARWIPHKLSDSQRLTRLKMSKELLKEYSHADSRRLYEIFTGDETWISYNEPERKSVTCAWVGKNEDGSRKPPTKKARPDRFGRKVLYSIFFDAHGSVAQICVPKGQRVTGEFYAYSCIAAVKQHYKERRPRTICKGLRILHDNARPHKTRLVKDTLESLGIVELQHPPHSPDLSPCDFWLFNNLKSHLSGRDFETNHQLGSAIFQYLKAISKEEYKKTFHLNKGKYFEHLM